MKSTLQKTCLTGMHMPLSMCSPLWRLPLAFHPGGSACAVAVAPYEARLLVASAVSRARDRPCSTSQAAAQAAG